MWWVETLLLNNHCLSQSHNVSVSKLCRDKFSSKKLLNKESSLLRFCSSCFLFAGPFIKSSKGTKSEEKAFSDIFKTQTPAVSQTCRCFLNRLESHFGTCALIGWLAPLETLIGYIFSCEKGIKLFSNFLQFFVVWPLISHDFRHVAVKISCGLPWLRLGSPQHFDD